MKRFVLFFSPILALGVLALFVFQNCGPGFVLENQNLSLGEESSDDKGPLVTDPPTIQDPPPVTEPENGKETDFVFSLDGFSPLRIKSKFGYIDGPVHGEGIQFPLHRSRYQKLDQDISPGLRIYNYWWVGLEYFINLHDTSQRQYMASPTPYQCPESFELYPPASQQKGAFHFYRCINRSELNKFKAIFDHDKKSRVLPIVTLYGTPNQYRGQDCQVPPEGVLHFVNIDGVNVHSYGCAPINLQHFEDYMRIMARELGQIVQDWSLWNENNNDGWFHISPELSSRGVSRVKHYSEMMKIVDRVFKEEKLTNYRLYVSTDFHWLQPYRNSLTVRDFLQGIWNEVGVSIPWLLNLHPYTDEQAQNPVDFPRDSRFSNSNYYGFGTLDRVLNFQKEQLEQRGVANRDRAPQRYALLGEQGWYLGPKAQERQVKDSVAIEICRAQDLMNRDPYILGATYNTLFVGPDDADNPSQNQLGLIPHRYFSRGLAQVDRESSYQAMKATSPDHWGRSSSHFCCLRAGLGCSVATTPKTPSELRRGDVVGVIDSVEREGTSIVVKGWSCQQTHSDPIFIHLYAGDPQGSGEFLGSFRADQEREPAVQESCQSSGQKHGFIARISPVEGVAGQRIYGFGVSLGGEPSRLRPLGNSGQLTAPP
jgi:hypothetical protein